MMKWVTYGLFFILTVFAGCADIKSEIQLSGNAGNTGMELKPVIEFEQNIQEMGVIKEGELVAAWFSYKNTGNAPLVIQDIKAGCGCTVPDWSEQPLEPGESGTLKIIFNSAGKKGTQNLRISVFSNAMNQKEDLLLKAIVNSNH